MGFFERQLFPCLRDEGLQRGQGVLVVHLTTKLVPTVNTQVPEIRNEYRQDLRIV